MNEPPRAEPVHDEHRQRGAQLVLPDGRDAARGQQRGAEDHAGAEPLVHLAVEAAVVVGEAVEREVVDQPVEADRDPCAPSAKSSSSTDVVEVEDLAGQVDSARDLGVGDLLDPYPQVVELEHLHVTAEVGRDEGEVGRDVEHARVEVAHQAVPRAAAARRVRRPPAPSG